MCKCTPEIKTPFCGAPGCQWPEREPPKETRKESDKFIDVFRLHRELKKGCQVPDCNHPKHPECDELRMSCPVHGAESKFQLVARRQDGGKAIGVFCVECKDITYFIYLGYMSPAVLRHLDMETSPHLN